MFVLLARQLSNLERRHALNAVIAHAAIVEHSVKLKAVS